MGVTGRCDVKQEIPFTPYTLFILVFLGDRTLFLQLPAQSDLVWWWYNGALKNINWPTKNWTPMDYLVTMQCSDLKCWALAFMWMTLKQLNLIAELLHPPHSNATPSRIMCPATPQILFRHGSRNITASTRLWPSFQTPGVSIHSSILGMQWNGQPHPHPHNPPKDPLPRWCPRRELSEVLCPCPDKSELFLEA